MSQAKRRIAWLAGTRGEILQLGPLFKRVFAPRDPKGDLHWFATTGEQGMAATQALDELEIAPHEEFELRNPSDDPAIRLHELMRDIERFLRRGRSTHAVFAGRGPTAAATALACHGRQVRALWLMPPDPAGVNAMQGWESGLERIIGSLVEGAGTPGCVRVLNVNARPEPKPEAFPAIEGRRPDAPLAVIATGRMLWGMQGVYGRLVQACGKWAREMPEVDWLLMRSLDWHLEGPLMSMEARPANLLSCPPLPYSAYVSLIERCDAALTDSPAIAAECMALGIPLLALGEKKPAHGSNTASSVVPVTGGELGSTAVMEFFGRHLRAGAGARKRAELARFGDAPPLAAFKAWLDR